MTTQTHSVFYNGSHLEVSNFAREAGLSHPTTKKYLNNMHYSQLTFRLHGYQYGPAKRFIKTAKTYYADNGILTSLNIPLNEGQRLENFVIAEFEKRSPEHFDFMQELRAALAVAFNKIEDEILKSGGVLRPSGR